MFSSRFPVSRRHAVSCAVLAVSCGPFAALADPNPYTLGVVETIAHDTNVFRAQDGSPISADWNSTTGLIGSLNQPIGRETLKANGEVDLVRYKDNKQLNSIAHSLSVEGDWATIGDLSGEVGFTNSSQLYTYNLYSADAAEVLRERNTQRTNQGFANVHLGVVTRWTIDLLTNALDRKYSAPTYYPYDVRRWDASIGTTYRFSPDLSTSLSYRHTKGEYPNFTTADSDDFSRNDLILGASYSPSGASMIKGRVSSGREKHSVTSQRSSRTWAADVQWIWQATGRTRFNLDFVRDDDTGATDTVFTQGQLASNDARRRTSIKSGVNYEVTSKISATLNGAYSRRYLDTSLSGVATGDELGSDRLYSYNVSLQYAASRALQLTCGATRERRTTQGATSSITYPYRNTELTCSGQFAFN